MHRLGTIALLVAVVTPVRAYVDGSPSLGKILGDSTHVIVMKVDKVNVDKRVILFTRTAELKGAGTPERIAHQIGDG